LDSDIKHSFFFLIFILSFYQRLRILIKKEEEEGVERRINIFLLFPISF